MSNLDFGAAVQDICTIAKWAKVTGASAVGVTGFCMGGAVALCALDCRGRAVLRRRRLLRPDDVKEACALVEWQARLVRRLL